MTIFRNVDGEFLGRAPISPVAILEASAMCAEVGLHLSMLEALEDDFKVVEKKLKIL